jgi:hypothetical protein
LTPKIEAPTPGGSKRDEALTMLFDRRARRGAEKRELEGFPFPDRLSMQKEHDEHAYFHKNNHSLIDKGIDFVSGPDSYDPQSPHIQRKKQTIDRTRLPNHQDDPIHHADQCDGNLDTP